MNNPCSIPERFPNLDSAGRFSVLQNRTHPPQWVSSYAARFRSSFWTALIESSARQPWNTTTFRILAKYRGGTITRQTRLPLDENFPCADKIREWITTACGDGSSASIARLGLYVEQKAVDRLIAARSTGKLRKQIGKLLERRLLGCRRGCAGGSRAARGCAIGRGAARSRPAAGSGAGR